MIVQIPKVESLEGGLPSNLKHMSLCNCLKLIASLKSVWGANPSLEFLFIGRLDVEYHPEEDLLPQALISLEISDCPNVKRLD